jgi:hypothetical protein
MMQLARRASLVVVMLLASVDTASAECAWVSWGVARPPAASEPLWGPRAAFSASDGGKRACDEAAAAERRDGNPLQGYVCLPDTVDPRGARVR